MGTADPACFIVALQAEDTVRSLAGAIQGLGQWPTEEFIHTGEVRIMTGGALELARRVQWQGCCFPRFAFFDIECWWQSQFAVGIGQ